MGQAKHRQTLEAFDGKPLSKMTQEQRSAVFHALSAKLLRPENNPRVVFLEYSQQKDWLADLLNGAPLQDEQVFWNYLGLEHRLYGDTTTPDPNYWYPVRGRDYYFGYRSRRFLLQGALARLLSEIYERDCSENAIDLSRYDRVTLERSLRGHLPHFTAFLMDDQWRWFEASEPRISGTNANGNPL